MQKIQPFLWFDGQAEAAAKYYVALFPRSRITAVARYGDAGPGPKGSVMTVAFELAGQQFVALNGGPQFKFTPAVSFFINCATQAEVDELWEKLSAGGKKGQCGWLEDRYGVSWQVVPEGLAEVIQDPRAMKAMMGMGKLDIGALRKAAGK